MDVQAGMLAQLFERSMGLGPEWEVSDAWLEERDGAPDELHVRVAHVRGRAVECPVCGRGCGTYDTRERTWRHLDIWQHETIVHCVVPRADCPDDGVRTVRMPREVRPNSYFTALFEAQVLVMALSGMTASAIASRVRESDARVWAILRRAVSEAREGADYSAVERVGIDDTARRRGQSYISTMVDLDGRRVVAVCEGRDEGSVGRPCGQLEERGGDRSRIHEVVEVKIDFARLDSEPPPSAPTYIRQSRHRVAPESATAAGEALSCGERSLVL